MDSLGYCAAMPRRIVSLCPSITETLHALGAWDRVVGRTEYCVRPEGVVDAVPTVGGTKRVKMDRLLALKPDLVFANREENRREDVETLEAAGIRVHVSFPRTVQEAAEVVAEFGRVLSRTGEGDRLAAQIRSAGSPVAPLRAVYLIWRKPWMAATSACFIGSVLGSAGIVSVLDDEPAYPTLTDDELRDACDRSDAVLLSSEPFPFEDKHLRELVAAGVDEAKIRFVDGQLLSWHGVRTIEGLAYAARLAASIR
jgi:ABC-type Fe3+-hydroxamate transport system substrate-binding protein